MKKLFCLLFLTIFFTGCTVKYDISLEDRNIKENVQLTISKKYLTAYNMTEREFIETNFHAYDGLEETKEYVKTSSSDSNNIYMNVERTYYKFDDFKNSMVIQTLFPNVEEIERNGLKTLKFSGLLNQELFNDTIGSGTQLDDVELNIHTDYVVKDSNADKIDKINNIYTWKIDKNSKVDEIYISYEDGIQYSPSIFDYISAYWGIVVGIILLLSGGSILCYLVQKNHQNNEL